MSGQGSSKEAPVSQAERAIIEYLKGSLRGSLSLVWHLVLEDLSLARRVEDEYGEFDFTKAVIADMSEAGGLCYIVSNILDSESLSRMVNTDAGRYWDLLSDVINGLIELRGILIKALSASDGLDDRDRAKELSPMVKERVGELLRGIISELGASVAKLEDELDECKEKLELYTDVTKGGGQEHGS